MFRGACEENIAAKAMLQLVRPRNLAKSAELWTSIIYFLVWFSVGIGAMMPGQRYFRTVGILCGGR
jgi:hypothetical protein